MPTAHHNRMKMFRHGCQLTICVDLRSLVRRSLGAGGSVAGVILILPMKIALGADHGGFQLKNQLRDLLIAQGHEVRDFGANSPDSTDYPDYAGPVAHAVADGAFDRGILVCGSGVGMAIAANKVSGVRSAAIVDTDTAKLSREHNDLNVLALGARVLKLVRVQLGPLRIGELPGDSEMTVRKLCDLRLGLYAAPAYLARRGEIRAVADLAGHDAIDRKSTRLNSSHT